MSHKNIHIRTLSKLRAGDSLHWTETLTDFTGWTLTYHLTGPQVISFSATEVSSVFTVDVNSATTAGWTVGDYTWAKIATSGTEREALDNGTLEILADPTTASSGDVRTHARITLDAIEAVIETRATKDQDSYTINGRSLNRTPIPDLLLMRDRYKALVIGEERRERALRGEATSARIEVRF